MMCSKSITKETVDELEIRFFMPKFVTTFVQELQKSIQSSIDAQQHNSAALVTQIEVQLSLLSFYRLYSSKFRGNPLHTFITLIIVIRA